MARFLEQQPAEAGPVDPDEGRGTARNTARALATALALLMISLLVVTRSRGAFDDVPADAEASFTTGDVSLSDDDRGSTLFDIPNMVPGRPFRDCIAVTYDGDVLPIEVAMTVDADGTLAPALQVTVESGEGGSFQECGGFEADEVVYEGTLEDLAARVAPLVAFTADDSPQTRSFRFTFELDDDVPVEGRARATADLEWTAES